MALLFSSGALAIGLGEIHGQPVLGESLRLRVEIFGGDKEVADVSCFRLVRPRGADDLPWLRDGTLSIQAGKPPVLQISTLHPLREPVLQIALQLACGHELYREYTILASPPLQRGETPVAPSRAAVEVPVTRLQANRAESLPVRPKVPERKAVPRRVEKSVPAEKPALATSVPQQLQPEVLPDRLLLSGGGDVGEPSLRLSTDLALPSLEGDAMEVRREMLRLEFRMLLALHEQATSQLEAAEKLRNMEATLEGLQAKAGEFAARAQSTASAVSVPSAAGPAPAAAPPPAQQVPGDGADEFGFSAWGLYGVLIGALAGVGGWLFWRRRRESEERDALAAYGAMPPEQLVDPLRANESDERGEVDLHFEPALSGMPVAVDVELDAGDQAPTAAHMPPAPQPNHRPGDSMLSISATTVNEHFEANPVMELADIMLSFGRVKGAAQALQEYIDNNPQEALQPWIRLMDVYRLAGMRNEFENVARNLNQNFNVEVQRWESVPASGELDLVLDEPSVPAVQTVTNSLEEIGRIMGVVQSLWSDGDVVDYLHQLLRDNRGGQRLGFSLPVVEEILFLIELKELVNRVENEKETGKT